MIIIDKKLQNYKSKLILQIHDELLIETYLKSLSENELIELFKLAELPEIEYWLAYYTLVKKRMVENTCMKLNISRAYYFILYNKILLKLFYTNKKV